MKKTLREVACIGLYHTVTEYNGKRYFIISNRDTKQAYGMQDYLQTQYPKAVTLTVDRMDSSPVDGMLHDFLEVYNRDRKQERGILLDESI